MGTGLVSTGLVLWGVGTPRTLRAHWMLHELELDYETRPIGSRTGETQTPEFRTLNPREKIPVLQDGELVLTESAAIVTYLAETYGQQQRLLPSTGPARAAYFEWCCFALSELDAHSLYVIRRHGDLAHLYGEAPNALAAAGAYFEKHAAVVEAQLDDGREFVLGSDFTGADVMLASCLAWGSFLGLQLGGASQAYLERNRRRPAQQSAAAVNYPTAATA